MLNKQLKLGRLLNDILMMMIRFFGPVAEAELAEASEALSKVVSVSPPVSVVPASTPARLSPSVLS